MLQIGVVAINSLLGKSSELIGPGPGVDFQEVP
jgi:hypothetical protein